MSLKTDAYLDAIQNGEIELWIQLNILEIENVKALYPVGTRVRFEIFAISSIRPAKKGDTGEVIRTNIGGAIIFKIDGSGEEAIWHPVSEGVDEEYFHKYVTKI